MPILNNSSVQKLFNLQTSITPFYARTGLKYNYFNFKWKILLYIKNITSYIKSVLFLRPLFPSLMVNFHEYIFKCRSKTLIQVVNPSSLVN